MGGAYYVYLLRLENTRRTYIGFSVDPWQRLRKHNGELRGGARYTAMRKPGQRWRLIALVSGFETARAARRFEWTAKVPSRVRRLAADACRGQALQGPDGRTRAFYALASRVQCPRAPWHPAAAHALDVTQFLVRPAP